MRICVLKQLGYIIFWFLVYNAAYLHIYVNNFVGHIICTAVGNMKHGFGANGSDK